MNTDPWIQADVWFWSDSKWKEGRVVGYEVVNPLIKQVKFKISCEKPNGEPTVVEITTKSKNNDSLEYDWVKKRDNDPQKMSKVTDMTSLKYLNEPEIIECMRQRFLAKEIYTSTGSILFAVNPFMRLDHKYSPGLLQQYHEASDTVALRKLGPHVYLTGELAYRKMMKGETPRNQSILVNGESGAGEFLKTLLLMTNHNEIGT